MAVSTLDEKLQSIFRLSSDKLWFTIALGLFVAVVNRYFWAMLGKNKASGEQRSSSSVNISQKKAPTATRVATIDPAMLNEPNFGYNVRVSKLLIHPIKSCRGISVQTSRYTPEGLENDRLWCVVDAETRVVITAREVAKMVLITSEIHDDVNSPYGGVLRVSFPEGSGYSSFEVPLRPTNELLMNWQMIEVALFGSSIDSRICEAISSDAGSVSEILSSYFEKPVHLVFKGQRPRDCPKTTAFPELKASAVFQDAYPILFLSEESMSVIETEMRGHIGTQGVEDRWKTDRLVIERFRPNIIFSGGGPFSEDLWSEISIGSTPDDAQGFLVVSKCTRCLLPNVSPETGIRDKAVPYKVLMKIRVGIDPENKWKPCVGCNGVPLGNGRVSVGDIVSIQKMASAVPGGAG